MTTPATRSTPPARLEGCFTAIITPFLADGRIDEAGLEALVSFQVKEGVSGVLAVGTTGESPTLAWDEHDLVVARVCALTRGRALALAGTGSNSTDEALRATEHAAEAGADVALLVDPYYNGPSSLEIRVEYLAPVARAFPHMAMLPYIIPGRTGAQLLPEDLAALAAECPNVRHVKEATGDPGNMARTRALCGPDFGILSGDDALTYQMMTAPTIAAQGAVSVMSNVAPGAVQRLTEAANAGDFDTAGRLQRAMAPLFDIVGVTTVEPSPFGDRPVKARNPLPLKVLMNILGMPAGPCRRPLGRMTRAGVSRVLEAARATHAADPAIFAPIGAHFGVDIDARLADEGAALALAY
jgi:4-hydroxy-tetrahydrodipicolinate synthase